MLNKDIIELLTILTELIEMLELFSNYDEAKPMYIPLIRVVVINVIFDGLIILL